MGRRTNGELCILKGFGACHLGLQRSVAAPCLSARLHYCRVGSRLGNAGLLVQVGWLVGWLVG